MKLNWLATDDPNVIAADGHPVQIERHPETGRFTVTGYGKTDTFTVFELAQWTAENWTAEHLKFNHLAGVEN